MLHELDTVLEVPDLSLRLPLAELCADTDAAPLRVMPPFLQSSC